MIKLEKITDPETLSPQLKIEIKVSHEIVDDCFLFCSLNAPSEGKQMLMQAVGEAYENYVKSLAKESDMVYLNREFGNVKAVNTTVTPAAKHLEEEWKQFYENRDRIENED